MSKAKKNILFICPYPFDEAPSQRFRYEQYLAILEVEGYHYRIAPFLDRSGWQALYQKGRLLKKIFAIVKGFSRRKLLLFQLNSYDFVFIHREATPIGPPFFEWAVKFIWNKPIIYDFDDAIWLNDLKEKGTLKALVKWKSKVRSICKWSYKISCGNNYLATYARKWNDAVIINPTTIDTENLHKPKSLTSSINNNLTIGWTGTHSTLVYLESIIDMLRAVHKTTPFRLLVIANKKPDFDFAGMEFIYWRKKSEIADLQKIDIGLMPLTDDLWSKGKCAFKALQFMALEIPVLPLLLG